jgi:hypothetical protein
VNARDFRTFPTKRVHDRSLLLEGNYMQNNTPRKEKKVSATSLTPFCLHDQIDRILLQLQLDIALECFEVAVFEEDIVPCVAPIQGVVNLAREIGTKCTRHGRDPGTTVTPLFPPLFVPFCLSVSELFLNAILDARILIDREIR